MTDLTEKEDPLGRFSGFSDSEISGKRARTLPFGVIKLGLIMSLLVEFNAFGSPLRVDIGNILVGGWGNRLLFVLFVYFSFVLYMIYGEATFIVTILVFSPFFAIESGKQWSEREGADGVNGELIVFIRNIICLYMLIFCLQIAMGENLFFDMFRDDTSIQPPYTILSSELSFAFEYIFAFMLLLIAERRLAYAAMCMLFLLSIYLIGGVSSIVQNFVILLLSVGAVVAASMLKMRFRYLLVYAGVVPYLLVLTFSAAATQLALWFYENYGSWRQMGNLFSYIGASFLWSDNLDYTETVGSVLRNSIMPMTGQYWFIDWFSSAFSLQPFLVSTIGVCFSTIYLAILLHVLKAIEYGTILRKVSFLAAFLIMMFTAPKWMMVYPFLLGYLAALSKRCALERRGSGGA